MNAVERDTAERFSEMYGALYGRVHAYAERRVGREAADEVAADTFLVAWRRLDALPREPLPWLYGVARNIVLRERTGRARQAAARDASDPPPNRTRARTGSCGRRGSGCSNGPRAHPPRCPNCRCRHDP